MKPGKLKLAAGLYVAGVLVIHSLVVWNARDLIWKGYPDFTIYYTAGTMVRQGLGHSLYNDVAQFEVQRRFAPQVATRLAALPFNHPPFEAVLFAPLTLLSYRNAFLLWTSVNLAMLAVLPILLRPFVPVLRPWPPGVWSLMALAFFPIFFALLQGQDAILLMFLYGAAFVALKKNRLGAAGAALACGLFKFHLVLPFLFLLLIQEKRPHGRRRIIAGFLLVATVLGAVSLVAVGARQMISYPHYVLSLEKTMARGAIMPSDMPNLRGALYVVASCLGASGSPYFDVLVLALSAGLFLLAAWISNSDDAATADAETRTSTDDLKFSLAALATVVVSYHGLGYDLCVLALPVLLVAGHVAGQLKNKAGSGSWTSVTIIAGSAFLLCSPLLLVLLMRYNRLAWLGWALLFCFVGLAGELRQRMQPRTGSKL
jgi:Glycosyltransferase family 87